MKELIAGSFVDTYPLLLLRLLKFLSFHDEILPDGHQTVHHTHCGRVYSYLLSCCAFATIVAFKRKGKEIKS